MSNSGRQQGNNHKVELKTYHWSLSTVQFMAWIEATVYHPYPTTLLNEVENLQGALKLNDIYCLVIINISFIVQ